METLIEIWVCIYNYNNNKKDTIYNDLTGRFAQKSSRSYQYVMVVYDYDENVVWGEAVKVEEY